ncbi:MAG: hypothetical protein V1777_01295 [Candidatus Micrarchaeota archaeon]
MKWTGLLALILGVLALALSANAYYANVVYQTSYFPTNSFTTYTPYYWSNYQAPVLPAVYYYPSYAPVYSHHRFPVFHYITHNLFDRDDD